MHALQAFKVNQVATGFTVEHLHGGTLAVMAAIVVTKKPARSWPLRPANTTLDTSLLRLVVLLYCLRLRASSQPQTFGLLGRVSDSY